MENKINIDDVINGNIRVIELRINAIDGEHIFQVIVEGGTLPEALEAVKRSIDVNPINEAFIRINGVTVIANIPQSIIKMKVTKDGEL